MKHPLLQAAQDLRDPGGKISNRIWENNTGKENVKTSMNIEPHHFTVILFTMVKPGDSSRLPYK